MKVRHYIILPLLILWCIVGSVQASARVLPDTIRVGLAVGRQELELVLPAGTIVSSDNGDWRAEKEAELTIAAGAGGNLSADGVDLGRGPVRLASAAGLLGWNRRLYRGDFLICRGANGLNLINEVGLEDYLCGVLPGEISPSWPMETIKAQAVAARTFTISRRGYHKKDGFDVCATSHCQVYLGATAEAETTNAAVRATAGQVITYQGSLAATYYHAASGGHTADVEAVWTTAPIPYLRGVPDRAEVSPYSQWTVDMEWRELESLIIDRYPDLGGLTTLRIADRTTEGRAIAVEIVGDRGLVKLRGEDFRSLLSLQSTWFELDVNYGLAPLPVDDTAAPAVQAAEGDMPWYGIGAVDWVPIPVRLVITGRGWGHGVGMSQWGAKALAETGYTYIMILKHYYHGIKVEDWGSPRDATSGP